VGLVASRRAQPGDTGIPTSGVPGAAEVGTTQYADPWWRRWPVQPLDGQHPVRGSFLDPRPDGFHIGIDVNVHDDRPEPDAPPGRTHRVYAVEGGTVILPTDVRRVGCVNGRIDVGHFSYWHVDPSGIVQSGQHVEAGQWIGWTCRTMWHVHLSEWATLDGQRVWINPLREGGKVGPFSDTLSPTIGAIEFFTPATTEWRWDATDAVAAPPAGTRLSPLHLRGSVDARALIADRQSFLGWFETMHPELAAPHHPQRVRIELTRLRDHRLVFARDVFRAEALAENGKALPPFNTPTPFTDHYAPGTLQNLGAEPCMVGLRPRTCAGSYWLRLFARPGQTTWNTRLAEDGRYVLHVQAWDAMGNLASRSVIVRVVNRTAASLTSRR
jgi:hypothetical protein